MVLDIQNIAVFIIFGIAVFFLIRKFLFIPKKKKGGSCGSGNCGC